MRLDERVISSVHDVPAPDHRWKPRVVNLLQMGARGAVDVAAASGSVQRDTGWSVDRVDPFPFEALASMLPRAAQRSLIPELVDLIPASSWFASLANMLVTSSWSRLRDPVVSWQGGCQECGMRGGLEAHEVWSYDAVARRQTLKGLRALCFQCHETQHLGRANASGRFDQVFDRLCRMNRLRSAERASYRNAVFDLWEERSRREWELDLSVSPDIDMVLKSSIVFAGDNWIVQPATANRREVASRIVNAEVLSDGRRLVIVPAGTLPGA